MLSVMCLSVFRGVFSQPLFFTYFMSEAGFEGDRAERSEVKTVRGDCF